MYIKGWVERIPCKLRRAMSDRRHRITKKPTVLTRSMGWDIVKSMTEAGTSVMEVLECRILTMERDRIQETNGLGNELRSPTLFG